MKIKPFLKWAGNKFRVIDKIFPYFPFHTRLVEPFMGSGSFFLNRTCDAYLGADLNKDLISVFDNLSLDFIKHAEQFFSEDCFGEKQYYEIRELFNTEISANDKAALFIYLNKYGFNGLCRYNRYGKFTTPFNHSRKKAAFPEKELKAALEKKKNAVFKCQSFEQTIKETQAGDLIYCDPPYLPEADKKSTFTTYAGNEFGLAEHKLLTELATSSAQQGICTIISNHDSPEVRKLYKDATTIITFEAHRSMGRYEGSKNKASELLAIFTK